MKDQIAILLLKTVNGLSNDQKSVVKFTNLNFRTIVGHDMFEEFDTFNLSLESIFNNEVSNLYLNNANGYVDVQISGLHFINSTFDSIQKTNGVSTTMCIYEFPSDSLLPHLNSYISMAGADFSKISDTFDLSINFAPVKDGNSDSLSNIAPFPEMSYHFIIRGVKPKIQR
jgi:hypothetical protein